MDAHTQIAVIGAGAAGLWAAEVAARAGRTVTVLEKTPRCGTKVLASGGTHCNLTTSLGERETAAHFGPAGARFLATALRVLPPLAVRARFEQWGVPSVEAPLEKVFPASGRARDVRDALESAARRAGAAIELDCAVESVERSAGGWRVRARDGRCIAAERVILCAGGQSYARTGTTGDGYAWLASLGLPVVEPVPALVPLSSPAAWVRELAGVALQDCEARLVDATGAEHGRRRRPLLFTHRGVSGPAAMDLSEPVARAAALAARARPAARYELRVDLCPALEREALRAALIAGAGRTGQPLVSRVLPLELPRRLLQQACAQAGFAREPRAAELQRDTRHQLVEALKGLSVPIDGTLGFDWAEVTAGGLALEAVDAGSLAVRAQPGLFVCGELLDLHGPIGGFNFQAAFATAELAGRAAARP